MVFTFFNTTTHILISYSDFIIIKIFKHTHTLNVIFNIYKRTFKNIQIVDVIHRSSGI